MLVLTWELRFLESVFDRIDVDHTGQLTLEQLVEALCASRALHLFDLSVCYRQKAELNELNYNKITS